MIIEINKDIERYQESVMMGLTPRQLVYSAISVAVGGTIVFLLYRYIGLTVSAYVAVPVVAPFALSGFYSYNGMSFFEVMQKRFYFTFANRTLTYVSTECERGIERYRASVLSAKNKQGKRGKPDEEKTEGRNEFEEAKKKTKKSLTVCIISIFILIVMAAIYKYMK